MDTEQSMVEIVEKPKSKADVLISNSHFAGNFGDINEAIDQSKDIFMIELDSVKDYVQFLPHLPSGYGITGGTSRSALIALLGETPPKPIDIDIEGIKELNADIVEKSELERTFLQNGRVEEIGICSSLIGYFNSRDFTINEVFIYGNHIYYSRRAAIDIENKVIRPTDYESRGDVSQEASISWDIRKKLLVKSLLLQIEFIKQFGNGSIAAAENWKWEFQGVGPFYLALGLDKAAKKGIELEFLEQLFNLKEVSKEDIPEGVSLEGVRRLAGLTKHWMIERHQNTDFTFSDEFFDRIYPENISQEDDQKLGDIYRLLVSRAVKIKGASSKDLAQY